MIITFSSLMFLSLIMHKGPAGGKPGPWNISCSLVIFSMPVREPESDWWERKSHQRGDGGGLDVIINEKNMLM